MKTKTTFIAVGVLGASAFGVHTIFGNAVPAEHAEAVDTLESVIASEELILAYTPKLKKLSKALANLSLSDYQSDGLFADTIVVRGLDPGGAVPRPGTDVVPVRYDWPIVDEPARGSLAEVEPWGPLLEEVDYFEHAKIYLIAGEFVGEDKERWRTQSGLTALARTKDGTVLSIHGKQSLTWAIDPDGEEDKAGNDPWHIVEWDQHHLEVTHVGAKLFEEVSDRTIVDAELRAELQHSELTDEIIALTHDENWEPPYWGFHWVAWDMHPGIAVVDIDDDGHDDVYVLPHWGAAKLLRNPGTGTFEDVTAQYGLPANEYATSALFVDLDNDGDKDLVVGRSVEPSRLFINEGGKFVDDSERLGTEPLRLVTSISAADYDRDGLIDLYLATYAARMTRLQQEGELETDPPQTLLAPYVTPDDASKLFELAKTANQFHGQVGPPNRLLHNVGGRFEENEATENLRLWRQSYHAGWADYDLDGDVDVYIANDFAPNNLMRNNGDGTFTDVTEPTGTADVGFGMGVAWGDYDGDQRPDLYVTNMFSKAGRRIAGGLGNLIDGEFIKMARGNTLFHNEGERFAHVSGLKPPAMAVEMGGWGWGAQFTDFDNDGDLDIHALSGFYTAPAAIAADVDL